jgi:hypothetical protein
VPFSDFFLITTNKRRILMRIVFTVQIDSLMVLIIGESKEGAFILDTKEAVVGRVAEVFRRNAHGGGWYEGYVSLLHDDDDNAIGWRVFEKYRDGGKSLGRDLSSLAADLNRNDDIEVEVTSEFNKQAMDPSRQ